MHKKVTTESHLRSVLKGFTWRIIATSTTVIVAFFFTGEVGDALTIGGIEFLLKIAVYYFHERIWQATLKGKDLTAALTLLKTFTWRIVASSTTFTIAYFILRESNPDFLKLAGGIALVESTSKLVLYYVHERLWHMLPPGSIRRAFNRIKSKVS